MQKRLTTQIAVCLSAFAWGVCAAAEKPPLGEHNKKPAQQDKAEAKPQERQYLRVVRNEDKTPIALETAIARYRTAAGVEVDLVGVVHVADKTYYEKLNELFKEYDAVLYELVARPEDKPAPGQKKSGLGNVQTGMTKMLDLDFQLDHIDYKQENFVHADMTPDEMSKSMKKNGESVWQLVFRSIGYSAAAQGRQGGGDIGMIKAMLSKDRPLALKRQMAFQMEDMKGNAAALDGPTGSTLLMHRNGKAFEVLDTELKAGKKKIAIFYGAAHLIDMDKRLREDLKMTYVKTDWLQAWSMK